MRRLLKRLFSGLFSLLPAQNGHIAALCQQYVDRFNGDNNDDLHSNGELDYLQRALHESRVVFDVGANKGDWTARVTAMQPGLVVHSFEPSATTFEQLAARSFAGTVMRNPFGLGSKAEERTLHVFAEGSGNNSLYQRQGLEAGWGLSPQQLTETIRLDTLDHYCQQQQVTRIDLLKLDVEGHELEVLRGATTMLQQGGIRLIQFEYGGCNIDSGVLLKDLFEFLEPFGYQFYKIFPQALKHIPHYDQRLENFRYQNWVASLGKLPA